MPGNRLAEYRIEVDPRRPRALLDPFPAPGSRGVFESGTVRIEAGGGVAAERRDARSRFGGLSGIRRNFRWDALDSVYFAGYAMWNYLTMPLLLTRPEVRVTGERSTEDGGAVLDCSFSGGLPTHSARQSFRFDRRRFLIRHDYTAEPVSRRARAAHHCAGHEEFDGLVFPTRRRVVPLLGRRALPGPTLVSLSLSEISVEVV